MARFSNSGSYSSSASLPTGGTYTVLFWYNLTVDTNTWQEFVRHIGSASHFFETRIDGTSLTFSGGGGDVGNFASTLGTWYCAAAAVNGTSVTVYHGTSPASLSTASGSCTNLGTATSVVVGNGVNGRMNNLKVYNSVLTAADIERELSQYMPIQTANLLRWHPLLSDLVDYYNSANLTGTGGTVEDGPPVRWARSRGPRVGASIPAQQLLLTGIPSEEAFGTPTLTVGPVISPTGIPTAEAFGTLSLVPGPVTVTATGIPTGEAFGTAALRLSLALTGIPSGEAFGTARIDMTVTTTGIPTGEAFGTPILQYLQVIQPTGIPSAEAFGTPEFQVTIDTASRVLTARLRITPNYELLVYGRVPAQSGPPSLYLIDPLDWSTLTWSSALSKPQTLSATCQVSTIPESIKQRLRAPERLPTELWLQRNGKTVFAGPLLAASEGGDEVSLDARGLMGYMDWWLVTTDLRFTQQDQFVIAKALVDHWQNLEYANYGINTDEVGTSGVLRDMVYERKEIHQISKRLEELGASSNGFDVEVDPASRDLKLWYPTKGVDRSTGPDAIVFDGASIDGRGGAFSIAPGDLATEAYGAGSAAGVDETFWSSEPNDDLLRAFGRAAAFSSFNDVANQGELDAHVDAMLNARDQALRAPGKNVKVTPDTDLDLYDVGDVVNYQISGLLGIGGAFRIRSRSVSVEQTGQETVTLEFV